jgi:hypothetical protein
MRLPASIRRAGRPAAVTVVVAAACLGVHAAAASADTDDVAVTIAAPDGTTTADISLTEIDSFVDIANQTTTFAGAPSSPQVQPVYPLPGGGGSDNLAGRSAAISGTSLSELATLVGVDPSTITSAMLQNGNPPALDPFAPGPVDMITGQEILSGFSDPNSGIDTSPNYAVLYTFEGTPLLEPVEFLRPMRSPGDDNVAGSLVVYPRGTSPLVSETIDVTFKVSESVLAVGATTASPANPTTGTPVSFSAPGVTLHNGAPDPNGDLTYSWNFGDGGPGSSAAAPVRAFPTAGTYQVTVTVTDPSEQAAGVSQPVTVVVGQGRGPSTPSSGPGTPSPGSQQSGGAPPRTSSTLGATKNLTGGGAAPSTGPSSGKKAGPTTASSPPPPDSVSASAKARPSGRLSTATGGGSGRSGGASGSAGSAAGSRGSATGAAGGTGQRARGAAATGDGGAAAAQATRQAAAASQAATLVGFLIDSPSSQSPLSALATDASPRELAVARSSQGSGQSATSIASLLEVAAVILVVSVGGLREFEPRARYRRL